MNRVYLVLVCLCCAFCARSQVVAVKTNVLYDVTTTFNLGAEVAFDKHLSLDISGNYNPWTLPDDKSIKHWLVQPELRYWLHERFNGHFLGVHALYADYDVAGKTLLNVMKSDYAYEGNAYGGGMAISYIFHPIGISSLLPESDMFVSSTTKRLSRRARRRQAVIGMTISGLPS